MFLKLARFKTACPYHRYCRRHRAISEHNQISFWSDLDLHAEWRSVRSLGYFGRKKIFQKLKIWQIWQELGNFVKITFIHDVSDRGTENCFMLSENSMNSFIRIWLSKALIAVLFPFASRIPTYLSPLKQSRNLLIHNLLVVHCLLSRAGSWTDRASSRTWVLTPSYPLMRNVAASFSSMEGNGSERQWSA
jgi:hypothetical protein